MPALPRDVAPPSPLTQTAAGLWRRVDPEFRIVPVVNEVAYQILRRETFVILRRRKLPIGTSLAVIARPWAR
ncbi:MAG: hypothetical protein ACYDBL_15865 [Candidatus Acidiferrales bacterium]